MRVLNGELNKLPGAMVAAAVLVVGVSLELDIGAVLAAAVAGLVFLELDVCVDHAN